MFLSFLLIFSLEIAAVVWAILERISGHESIPTLEMIDPRYFKLFIASSFRHFPNLSLESISVVCLTSTPASSFSLLFTIMSPGKRRLVKSRFLMPELPSWSFSASITNLFRKRLTLVSESRYPCRTPMVVLNKSPVLPLNSTAFCILSDMFLITRLMLQLILYFRIVKDLCHTVSKIFLNYMKAWYKFC